MGTVCCCFRSEELEQYVNPSSSVYRNCICLRCFVLKFINVYTLLFQRGDARAISLPVEASSTDESLSEIYRAPPRPLPYDADPRFSRLQQREGLVSRREKNTSHLHEESEPLRRHDSDKELESLSTEEESNENPINIKSSLKVSSGKTWRLYTQSEDEDVCPTCLEEYTIENPKIMTKCSHHYHLGCIYEWMERSDNCPVCGQVMLFDETI